eukprot:TRINITY_DN4571_c0_g1_i2.p1 TRINITY_DN4571_c0_g1~~TRINITY_DN4571_c0_g1_i2.p1  ORF type:complete len:230 (-),score=32.02 TRINITY_DN4571_c0_g1_i2:56-745(-)
MKVVCVGLLLSILVGMCLCADEVENFREYPSFGFYEIRRDFRKCVSPLCGGYFVKLANSAITPCHDGFYQNECYVHDISGFDLPNLPTDSRLPEDNPMIIVKGRMSAKNFGGAFGELGELEAVKVFQRATSNPKRGKLFALRDNQIRCITNPCFSTDSFRLNAYQKRQSITRINYKPSQADEEQIAYASREVATTDGVLVYGGYNIKKDPDRAVFIVRNLYRQVVAKKE